MIEAGALIGYHGEVLLWHMPPGRSSGCIPDSPDLWAMIWRHRLRVYGFAHSHPGSGMPSPSWEDVTTFAGVEVALGRRLHWWITSSDMLSLVRWTGPDAHHYGAMVDPFEPEWVPELRQHTNY